MNDIERAIELLKADRQIVVEGYKKENMTVTNNFIEFDLAISALEKQIAKKPAEIKNKHNFNMEVIYKVGYCPVCKNDVSTSNLFCNICGQKLDWSEVQE